MTTRLLLGQLALIASLLMPISSSRAEKNDEPTPEQLAAYQEKVSEMEAAFQWKEGAVVVGRDLATISLTGGYRFLGPKDAATVLYDLWGNPRQDDPLGMIFPKDMQPSSKDSWAIIVTYDDEGHIDDSDASKINWNDKLKEMQEGTTEASKERVKEGYGSIKLVGWAEPPTYDSAAKKLYWAKELSFDGSSDHTLNYNVRILGARGNLVLNGVSGMDRLAEIKAATPELLAMVDFNKGNTYADYVPGTDKLVAGGIATLVGGKILAKAGLFVLLAKFWKVGLLGFAAVSAAIKKFFRRSEA
jgi:uncharacterized membrane-anchored protein